MNIKIEMKGTGGGRWMPRQDAKRISRKARRTLRKALTRGVEGCSECDGNGFCRFCTG